MNYFSKFILLALAVLPIDQVSTIGANNSNYASLNLNNLLFYETFEGKKPFLGAHGIEAGDWDYALQYVTNPVYRYRSSKSVRFEIREDQHLVQNGKRAEVTIIKGLPSKNMWYSFAVYFPTDGFAKDSQLEVINQWYQHGSPATSLH